MEIAIPLIALGGMYIVSNQSNENCSKKEIKQKRQENFTNMGIRTNLAVKENNFYGNYLPNQNIPPQNFPVSNINELVDTVQEYPNPNTATDKYFDQNLYEKKVNNNEKVGQDPQQIYSLTGNYLNSEQFKHNNMMPFYGGKLPGKTYEINNTENILDNYVGAGSQVIKKIEQAPLFKPEQNMQWAYGMPNQSDFIQSRQNPVQKNHNTKPFDSIMVGPGLDQGYCFNGSNGFNSGMEARDKWLPYTVDQLRVDTNPKLEYKLINHEGPANAYIKHDSGTAQLGRIEKNRPDTFYINTQDRWFTTTGSEKGEYLRPIQEMGVIRRNDIPNEYMGPVSAIEVKASSAPQNYEKSKRQEPMTCDINPSRASGKGPHTDGDNFLRSHTNYENHRSTIKQPETIRTAFGRSIGAVIAPIMDILKPTRKDETINSVRVFGEAGSIVPKGYAYNHQNATPTTIKETTIHSLPFQVNNQKEGMYVNNYGTPVLTQRDTTSCQYYSGAGGYSSCIGDVDYSAAYRQHNNDIKSQTIMNRPNQGGTQIFNPQINLTTIKNDSDCFEGRVNPAYSGTAQLPPSVQTYGKVQTPQYYNECFNCDRIQPDILNAFKNNPYTHPLTTSV